MAAEEGSDPMSDLTLPGLILEDLRWKPDQAIINPFGESVWLKQMPGYITDCCFTDSPCVRHESTQ
jgi:hypothetical protein